MAEENKDQNTEETQEETAAPEEEEKAEEAPSDEGEDVEVPEKFKSIVESIENMTVLDLHELVGLLEKKFGVSAVAVAAGGGGGAAEEEEEQTEFTVHLSSVGDNKIQVIKAAKNALGLGLKEAKELVEGAPVDLKAGMPKEEAEELKTHVEEAGGSVELK